MALGSGRRIVVEFIGDASALRKGVREGEAALQGFSGKAQAAGRIAGRVLAGGLLLAGAAAVSATKAAAEDEAAQAQLAQQLKQAAGATDSQIASTEDWITAQGKATGLSDDELRPALARLATATGDVEEAQRLAALAMDVSAGSGKSYQQVTEALAKAQNGNIGALGRLGIATKDADGRAKSLGQIQKDLAGKYMGAAAKAAETTAGKQKILTTQFGELQEQIGAKLLPVMVQLSQIGLKIVAWISENTKVVGVFVAALGGLLAITWAVGAATKAKVAIETIAAAATKAYAAAQWVLNAAMSANPIGLIVIGLVALIAGLVIAYKKSETFRKIVNAAFGAVAKAAKVAVDFIKRNWQTLLAIITGPIGLAVLLVVKHWDKIKAGAQAVKDFIADKFGAAKDAIVSRITAAKDRVDAVWDAIKSGFATVRDRISEIASSIKTSVTNAFDAMLRPIQAVIDKIQWLIDKIKSIPKPDLGDLPLIGRVGGGSKSASSLSSGGSLRGGSAPVIINVNGALDARAVAAQIEKMLILRNRDAGPLQFQTI